jgi:hypothetical protein
MTYNCRMLNCPLFSIRRAIADQLVKLSCMRENLMGNYLLSSLFNYFLDGVRKNGDGDGTGRDGHDHGTKTLASLYKHSIF